MNYEFWVYYSSILFNLNDEIIKERFLQQLSNVISIYCNILQKFSIFLYSYLIKSIVNNNDYVVGIISGIISGILVTILFSVINHYINHKKLKVILNNSYKLIKQKKVYNNELKYILVQTNFDFENIYNELSKVLPIASTYMKSEKLDCYLTYLNILSNFLNFKKKTMQFIKSSIKFNKLIGEYSKIKKFNFTLKTYLSDIESYANFFRKYVKDNLFLVENYIHLDDYLHFELYYEVLLNIECRLF